MLSAVIRDVDLISFTGKGALTFFHVGSILDSSFLKSCAVRLLTGKGSMSHFAYGTFTILNNG